MLLPQDRPRRSRAVLDRYGENMEQLRSVKTVSLAADSGPTHGIMVAVDVKAGDLMTAWVPALAEKIKLHRMVSPPDTSVLLITIIGTLEARSFLESWNEVVAKDQALSFFIKQMRTASFVHGTADGKVLFEGSLLTDGRA